MLRGIIAEDNPYFRGSLNEIITSFGGIDVGHCVESGEELLEVIEGYDPEIVFLDIGLPGLSGIDTAKYIRAHHPSTEIIFITSHNQYYKEAFELYATDYIQKPINVGRLKKTINRIKASNTGKILEVYSEEKILHIREKDIYMVEAFKHKVRIYTREDKIEASHDLKEIEAKIGSGFFRTGRSYLVNVRKVTAVKPSSRTSFELFFADMPFSAYLSKKLYDEFRTEIKKIYPEER